MSAGFQFAGELFPATPAAVELFTDCLGAAAARYGPANRIFRAFRPMPGQGCPGPLVILDPLLVSATSRESFVELMDAAAAQLLRDEALPGQIRDWLGSVVPRLRERIATYEDSR
jgi:hypothetical protein